MFSVKELVESSTMQSVPSNYICHKTPEDFMLNYETENIPTIDFLQLTSSNPNERSNAIQQLGDACRDWGFFMLINHGVPETLREKMVRVGQSFFDLSKEEKMEFAGEKILDPIRYGTSFNLMVDTALFWRDYLKCLVHPHFNAPSKPPGLRMNVELGSQVLVINCYPPCPNPELVMGLPAHTDHGLLTLLQQNHLGGLQIQHKGKWIPINPLPKSFLINTGDHMEILTNGKYKSIIHRAVVNTNGTRISIGTAHGPNLDTIVGPAPELVGDDNPALYRAITYRDYILLQQSNELDKKTCLERIRI
ncbi:hypothetical protein V8G54_034963 [Vigna mungo]|uniref:Fe2OG dioxygenase domain-containing protein n=1 Tax=Vigna mungo TaxID=3915 RepID=A0AAQ3MED0_VIGMU